MFFKLFLNIINWNMLFNFKNLEERRNDKTNPMFSVGSSAADRNTSARHLCGNGSHRNPSSGREQRD